MNILAIKHLLLAQSMPRAIGFWRAAFGLELVAESDLWSEMRWGSSTLALHGGGDGSRNPTDLSIQVENIVKACRIVKEAGGRIVAEPMKRPEEPIVMAVFRDTEGNEVMLTQAVATP
jgi:predicted enzyme related to lactoylglutathione lyase